jgi:hypothetical protein
VSPSGRCVSRNSESAAVRPCTDVTSPARSRALCPRSQKSTTGTTLSGLRRMERPICWMVIVLDFHAPAFPSGLGRRPTLRSGRRSHPPAQRSARAGRTVRAPRAWPLTQFSGPGPGMPPGSSTSGRILAVPERPYPDRERDIREDRGSRIGTHTPPRKTAIYCGAIAGRPDAFVIPALDSGANVRGVHGEIGPFRRSREPAWRRS